MVVLPVRGYHRVLDGGPADTESAVLGTLGVGAILEWVRFDWHVSGSNDLTLTAVLASGRGLADADFAAGIPLVVSDTQGWPGVMATRVFAVDGGSGTILAPVGLVIGTGAKHVLIRALGQNVAWNVQCCARVVRPFGSVGEQVERLTPIGQIEG